MSKHYYGFSFDATRCTGCMACITACMDQNDLEGAATAFRQVSKIEMGDDEDISIGFVSLACFHCADAPCLNVCQNNAIFMNDEMGTVVVDREACIGCGLCAMACPFGAPRFDENGKMFKCTMCAERVRFEMDPACVHTCPTRALEFGPIEEIGRKKVEKISRKIFSSQTGVLPGMG